MGGRRTIDDCQGDEETAARHSRNRRSAEPPGVRPMSPQGQRAGAFRVLAPPRSVSPFIINVGSFGF